MFLHVNMNNFFLQKIQEFDVLSMSSSNFKIFYQWNR